MEDLPRPSPFQTHTGKISLYSSIIKQDVPVPSAGATPVKQKKIRVSPRLNKGKCGFNWVNWAGGASRFSQIYTDIIIILCSFTLLKIGIMEQWNAGIMGFGKMGYCKTPLDTELNK